MKVMKAGRRPRRRTPMPRSSFTAFVEQHVFLLLYGEGELSNGVQKAVRTLTKMDDNAGKTMVAAQRIVTRVKDTLGPTNDEGEPLEQEDVLRYIKEHWYSLVDEAE